MLFIYNNVAFNVMKPMLKQVTDLAPSKWIDENTDTLLAGTNPEWRGNFVSHCVPSIYSAYLKILHPIYEDLSISDRSITWNDLKEMPSDPNDPVDQLLGEATIVYGGEYQTDSLRRIRWKELADQRGLIFHPEINVDTFTRSFEERSWPRYLIGPDEGLLEDESCKRIVDTLASSADSQKCY